MALPDPVSQPPSPLVPLLDRELSGPALDVLLDLPAEQVPAALWERALLGPARSFLARPGKELRARLVETAYLLAEGPPEELPAEATAIIELLHAGSLIVDDIEDGSDHRRGGPALHRAVGTPVALNTGNWMYFLPMVFLDRLELTPERALALHQRLSLTLLRCHHGQALDLSVRVGALPQADMAGVVSATTRLKTASLLELAAHLGSVVAGAHEPRTEQLARFGRRLGVGLQMLDDLSALENPARSDKAHEDLGQERPTWPWAWLARDLDRMSFVRLQRMAREVGAGESHPEMLAEAMRQALGGSGRREARAHVEETFDGARRAFGPSAVLRAMEAEVVRLEAAYG